MQHRRSGQETNRGWCGQGVEEAQPWCRCVQGCTRADEGAGRLEGRYEGVQRHGQECTAMHSHAQVQMKIEAQNPQGNVQEGQRLMIIELERYNEIRELLIDN